MYKKNRFFGKNGTVLSCDSLNQINVFQKENFLSHLSLSKEVTQYPICLYLS